MSDEPRQPDAPAAGPEAATEAPGTAATLPTTDEVEYVYEDEHGNRVAAPEGGVNPDDYEEVAVEAPPEGGEAPPAPAAGSAEAPADATSATKRLKPVSSRRGGERKSGRQSRPMTPEELKKVRVKVLLLLGLLSLIPILTAAIFIVRYYKTHKKPTPKQPRLVDNMYDQGRKLYLKSSPHLAKADRLYDQGKRPEACEEYKLCKKDFTDALDLVQKWMADQDMNEHYDVETMAREIRIKLKHVNDRLSMLEASPPPDPAAPN